jgi:hypothetical protein
MIRPIRSVFMTSSGDPFTLLNSMSWFDVWQDEIDELWIAINSTMEREVMSKLIALLPKKAKILYINKQIGFGKPLKMLLELSPNDNVLFLEDDTIIFEKGVVDNYFKMLEQRECDLIGSPRMSCSAEVAEQLKTEFNLNYEGRGDKGPNFWPCFLWVRKDLLLKTDCNFDPTHWGDTFVWMSIQLRRMNISIKEIPQYHCSPDDFTNKENGWGIFDGECGYMHLGSLSSGIQSYLLDEHNVPLADREANLPVTTPKPIENTPDMQIRMHWFLLNAGLMENYDLGIGLIYSLAVVTAMQRAGMTIDDLSKWGQLYKEVIYGND